ncbi:MAG: thioredoxin-like domain-containing protein [Saprospiraceae bacterium]
MYRAIFFLTFTIYYTIVSAQTIRGKLSVLPNQSIKLEGFNGLKTYQISTTTSDSLGNFKLNYEKADYGVGYLMSADNKPLIVILSGEDIEIKGEALSAAETIRIITGQENQWFAQYAAEHPKREQVLGAWAYLDKTYTIDSLFAGQKTPKKAIQAEKQRIHAEDVAFINKLPKDSYVSWFLPTRKLLSSVSAVAQHRPEEIPATLKALRSIDYSDSRLYKSGLLSDAIDSHVWFIENSMSPLDSVHALLIRSIDIILSQLKMDERKYNDITDYLFGLLEQRSMFPVAEYLSLKVLEDRSCTVDIKLANKLEGYRKLKIGNKAPDITFGAHSYFPEHIQAGSLSAIDAAYKVVVFAANWCNHCQEVMPKLAHHYTKWRAKGIEVVLVSLDENMGEFTTFAAPLPFTATCDYKKWESQPVKDYHIFGTPSFYLLKNNLEIVLKPSTVEQIDAWIDWHVK